MRIFRQGISWVLLIDILISYIAFMGGMNIYRKIITTTKDSNTYTYNYSYEYYIGSESPLGKTNVLSIFDGAPGNIVLSGCLLYMDIQGSYRNCQILYKQSEELLYPVISGSILTESDEPSVAIGKGLLPYCKKINGENYVLIEGETYRVVAVIGTEDSKLMEDSIILFYNSLDPGLKSKIENECDYTILQQSDSIDLSNDNYEIIDKIYDYVPDALVIPTENTGIVLNFTDEATDRTIYGIICIFATVNCIVISELWVIRRRREIKIRKVWGYSNIKLFALLYRDILSISLSAIILGTLLQIVGNLISGKIFNIDLYMLFFSVIYLVLASLIIVLVPVYKVYREIPVQNSEV